MASQQEMEKWQKLSDAFDSFECSPAVFCLVHDIHCHEFTFWRAKLKKMPSNDFIAVQVVDAPKTQESKMPASLASLQLKQGGCIQIHCEHALENIIRALG